MKRLIAILLVLCIVMNFTGCIKHAEYLPQDNINYNYNNISADNSSFWITNEAIYYIDAPLYAINYYSVESDGRKKITTAESAAFAKILPNDNMLYMLDWVDNTVYRLHSYDTDTGVHTVLDYLTNVYTYFVAGQNLYYLQDDSDGESVIQSFNVYSLQDGASSCIAASVLTSGMIDDQPVYVVEQNTEISIYSYDDISGTSRLLDSFIYPLAEDERIGYNFNFTSNQFIFTVMSDEAPRLVCYNFEADQIAEFNADNHIYSVIAYENYAFMVVRISNETGNSNNWENAIFRISLQNGELEKIAEVGGMVDSFVASDDCVYINSTLDPDNIYRYDIDGTKALICRW